MKEVYVLVDVDNQVLGVFSTPKVPEKELTGYFGSYKPLQFEDVRDSGVEWVLRIHVDSDRTIEKLTMYYFRLNKVD